MRRADVLSNYYLDQLNLLAAESRKECTGSDGKSNSSLGTVMESIIEHRDKSAGIIDDAWADSSARAGICFIVGATFLVS